MSVLVYFSDTDSWETVHVEDNFANITAGFSFTQNGTYHICVLIRKTETDERGKPE